MEDQLFSFDPGTQASKAPMPTDFRHLLGWAPKDERFLTIHNQEELTNLSQQLNETLNLQVSNIYQRTLSYIFGETDLGPRIIKGTLEGALHVAIDGLLSDTKNLLYAPISENTIAAHDIITATAGQKIHVINLIFTVAGAVGITLRSGANDISGAMDFGDTEEPKGAVIPLGLGPLVCNTNEAFVMDLDAAVQVSGFCTYYKQLA